MTIDVRGSHPKHFWLQGKAPERPIEFDEQHGMWQVYGYSEALQIISDATTFNSDMTRLFPEMDLSMNDGNMIQMDDPEHRRLRVLVSHAFTRKVVADLEPRIAEITHELIDAMSGKDEIELVAEFAYPLPVIVIAELLGVPASDRDQYKEWVDRFFQTRPDFAAGDKEAKFEEHKEAMDRLNTYIAGHAAERRTRPREDLLTKLVEAEVDGDRLTDAQVVNFANLLLVAGHVTTTMLLGNTILCLDQFPEAAERVRADRSLVPGALEESLRLLSPFPVFGRATAAEVEIADTTVPKDQLIMVWTGAANRDERQFAAPHQFRPDRDPNPHLGFGRGVHFCLGAPLARLEGRIALNALLDRFPVLRTDPNNPPRMLPSSDMCGVTTLPLHTN